MHSPNVDKAEKKYGAPFRDILRALSDEGLTVYQAAKKLGYVESYSIKKYMRTNNITGLFCKTKKDVIEEEYGESFEEIVRGYAADGYSKTATAGILELGRHTFMTMIADLDDIVWPERGKSVYEQELPALTDEQKKKLSQVRLGLNLGHPGAYEARTGEPALDAIKRLAPDNCAAVVSRAIGWKGQTQMMLWLRNRGEEVQFKKVAPRPPRNVGWQSKEVRAVHG